MSAPVARWICSELSELLGFQATDDIALYILEMKDVRDLEEYLCGLVDQSEPKNRQFIDKVLQKWTAENTCNGLPNNVQVYKKSALEDKYTDGFDKQTKTKRRGKKQVMAENDSSSGNNKSANETRSDPGRGQHLKASPDEGKKKTKFVPLFTQDGDARTAAMLPGRHKCDCQAVKHRLINNCTECGRVVCEQEGSGPCLFCGSLVCTKAEQEILSRGSKKSEKLRKELMDRGQAQSAEEKAVEQKNKLLEFDRNAVKRTQVIDDESDYFATEANQWLSPAEKELLKKREDELRALRHASRKDRKITLDFAGRRVIEDSSDVDVYNRNDAVVQQVHYGMGEKQKEQKVPSLEEDFRDLVNPNIDQNPPEFIQSDTSHSSTLTSNSAVKPRNSTKTTSTVRIQDRDLQEMSDEGMCLSMHQPWASLLVAGIKIHEGRTWYSTHRGRLWIAATAKVPSKEDIDELEASYRRLYSDQAINFPKDYPVGCLLGCVDVVDVLDQQTYEEKYPDGESSSPYVFICENPQELIVKFPIRGKHKIYKLDRHIHQAAKKGLRQS